MALRHNRLHVTRPARRHWRLRRAVGDRATCAERGLLTLESGKVPCDEGRSQAEDVALAQRRKSSASSITSTPRLFAFSSLLPASSPATRKSVDFETEPVTRPPAVSIISVAFVLLMVGKVPVMTTVFPLNTPPAATARGSVKFNPWRRSFSMRRLPAGSEK